MSVEIVMRFKCEACGVKVDVHEGSARLGEPGTNPNTGRTPDTPNGWFKVDCFIYRDDWSIKWPEPFVTTSRGNGTGTHVHACSRECVLELLESFAEKVKAAT